ncbi:conserved hypothetical protein [Vibrio chagasii]|nr:conserved hypothetical protein [Vibrio chagasii]CAH7320004.1 conserved hypothetical protein [Vibrio chagasii]
MNLNFEDLHGYFVASNENGETNGSEPFEGLLCGSGADDTNGLKPIEGFLLPINTDSKVANLYAFSAFLAYADLTKGINRELNKSIPEEIHNKATALQAEVDAWKLEYATLLVRQCHFPLDVALEHAESALENIDYDIENTSASEAVDDEIDAMRSSL